MVRSGNPQNVTSSLPTCEDVTGETCLTGLPDGIPPAGSQWAMFKMALPTTNLADDRDPTARLPETSTPMKTTPESGKHPSKKKKLNVSKIQATHLLYNMRDQQEKARNSIEWESQVKVRDQTGGGSGREPPHGLPGTLPDQPGNDRIPTEPTNPLRRPPGMTTNALMMPTRS